MTDDIVTRMARKLDQKRQERIQAELEATDWDDTPIVDVITPRMGTTSTPLGTADLSEAFSIPSIKIARHEHPAPPLADVAAVADGPAELVRITRPLLERLRDDPDLGHDHAQDVDAILSE